MPISLFIIGHVDDPEFAGLSDWLNSLDDVAIEQTPSLADYLHHRRQMNDFQTPDLILVLERHPDEHAAADINQLIETHPLARIVCGYGPWSESSARTRAAWPAITWTPISLLRQHVLSEMAVIHGGRPAPAITADRADAFEQRYAASPVEASDRGLSSLKVAINAPDAEYRSMLTDELRLQRAEVVDCTEQWDVLLFDAHPETHRLHELRRLLAARRQASGRIIILHELPSAAAREPWSSDVLDVRVVSKLAPLAALS